MKLVALVITLGLWLGVTGLSTPTVTRFSGVPLALRVSNNAEITNTPIQEIDVVLSGDKRKIAQLNKGDLFASIDDEADIGAATGDGHQCRYDHVRPVIAAHGIDGNPDHSIFISRFAPTRAAIGRK